MYGKNIPTPTLITVNNALEGETIEAKMRRIENNKEPISDSAPVIYTERKDGVLPQYDIRTDRFDIAVDAMTAVAQAKITERRARIEEREKIKKAAAEGMQKEGGSADPTSN